MTTRKLCSTPGCPGYFDAKQGFETICETCAVKEHDRERASIFQDNAEAGNWLRPDDALVLVQCRAELARTREELMRWKLFGEKNFSTICSIAQRGFLPGEKQRLADNCLNSCYNDFSDIVEYINGPVYSEKRG